MGPGPDIQRWSFQVETPLGPTTSSYEVSDSALRFQSDDVLGGGSDSVRWDSVREGGTATMAGMGGRGGPDLPGWVPPQLEWLTLSRTDGAGQAFMRPLPQGGDRDAIVAAVRDRLGSRWAGEGLPLKQAQQQLGLVSQEWSTLKVVGLVVSVLVLLVLMVILLGLLLSPVVLIPACLLLGGWLLRRALAGHRDGLMAAQAAVVTIDRAPLGPVRLEGRAVTAHPTPAAITGRACVWWDATVELLYEEGDQVNTWRQVASRHGGRIDAVDIDDGTGRLPVWLRDATLVLQRRTWEPGKDALPAQGIALLDELGFPWHGSQHIRVSEESLEADGTLHVYGALDERGRLPPSFEGGALDRLKISLVSGAWRRSLVAAVPRPMKTSIAVLIGFLDLFTGIGTGKDRPVRERLGEPPSMAPDARLVWKGREGRPFVVSDRPSDQALAALRQRALVVGGIGAGVLCFALYLLADLF